MVCFGWKTKEENGNAKSMQQMNGIRMNEMGCYRNIYV